MNTRAALHLSRAHLHNPQLPGAPFALPGSGPDAALLFHGFTATPNEVLGLGITLQQAGYSAYGPLLPGHGTSPRDLNRTPWQAWTAAAEQAFDELSQRHRRVIVGGESLGGLLALYLAAARPAAALLVYAPAAVLDFSPLDRLALRLFAPLGVMLPKNDLKGNLTWQGYRFNPLRAVLQILAFQAAALPRLPRVCAPAFIAQGGRDRTVNPRGAQLVYERIGSPVKTLRWFDDSPHCLLIAHQRRQVLDATLAFLGQTPWPNKT